MKYYRLKLELTKITWELMEYMFDNNIEFSNIPGNTERGVQFTSNDESPLRLILTMEVDRGNCKSSVIEELELF